MSINLNDDINNNNNNNIIIVNNQNSSKSINENLLNNNNIINNINIINNNDNINNIINNNNDNNNNNNNEINNEIEKLKKILIETTEKNLSKLLNENIIHTEFKKHFLENKQLKTNNNKNIPIFLIFNTLFNPKIKSKHKNFQNNFILYCQHIRNEYDCIFDNEKFNENQIPNFYKNYYNSYKNYKNLNNINSIKNLINECLNDYPKILSYTYKYKHPIPKPVFMGPKLLECEDIYNFFFISPKMFIVEIKTNSSGFMLLDSFYTLTKYVFEWNFDDNNNINDFNTVLNSFFNITFIKDIWFKKQVEGNGYPENEDYEKNFIYKNYVEELSLHFNDVEKIYLNEIKNNSNNNNNNNYWDESIISENSEETILNESDFLYEHLNKKERFSLNNSNNIYNYSLFKNKKMKNFNNNNIKNIYNNKNEIYLFFGVCLIICVLLNLLKNKFGDFFLYFILLIIIKYLYNIDKKINYIIENNNIN